MNRADSEMSSQLAALQGQLVAGIEDGSKRVGAACETVERLKGHISQFERVLASDPSTVYRDIENRLFSFESALKTQLEAATSRLSTISAMSKEHFAAESNAVLSAVERARDIADNAGDRFSIVSGQMLVKLASASKHLNSQMEQKIGTVAHDLEATVEEVVSRLNREITRQMGNIPAELETLSLRTSQALNALSLEQRQEVERTTIEIERHTNTVERRLEDFIGRSANQAERLEATIERQSISLASDIERQATSVDGAFRKASTIAIDGIGKAAREARDSMSVVVGQMTEPLTASSRALEATLAGTQSEWQKTLEAMHTRLFRSAAELHAGLDQKSKAVVLEIISAAAEQWTAMDRELRRRSDALEASVAARIEVLCAKLAQTDELVVKSVDDARTRMVAGAELAGQSVSTSIERATRSIKVSMDVSNEAVGEALAGAKVAASEHVKLVRGAVQELEENLISATTSVKDAVRTESANVQETIDKTAGEIESRLAEGQARFSVMHDEKSLEIIGRVEDFEVQSIRRIEVASQRVEEATRNAASFTANRLDNLSAAVISLLEGENDILTRNAAE